MVADSMGFQHLFHTPTAASDPVMSSSCLLAARTVGAQLDPVAVGIQSLLGWQLGQRTLFAGVDKLAPGAVAHLDREGEHVTTSVEPAHEALSLERAVTEAADLLRTSLAALLDDHPDAVLQLTGGMDSRLLLSAVPAERRRGLHAMTLEVPGTDDVRIARSIAQRYGLQHEVHGLSSIRDIDPAEAWGRCTDDAARLDAMSDPIALASQRVAEQAFDQGVRISGLGGEIARGFYYLGRVRDRAYSRTDAERLASWRMFVNEAVEPDLLDAEFMLWARDEATTQVHHALTAAGDEWFHASDELYVRHRMQRWAGATDTAVSDRRVVINPMLDPGFLDIARRLAPRDKAGSRFLARLQMELDPELGQRPLDRRPAPSVYASPPRWQPAMDAAVLARRAARKGIQKVRRGARPPAGGTVMAHKVVEFWRAHPETLRPFGELDFVRDDWVEDVLEGRVDPRPSSVAFVTNLVVAQTFGEPPLS
jgi:asparagine synthase (glutamine-hydrolysing)